VSLPMVGAGPSGVGGGVDWWDPDSESLSVWAAYQPKGAASLADSYTDLSGNGNDLSVGKAPDWDATNGWKFDGASQHYLKSDFIPDNDQSQTVLVQFSNFTGTGTLFGLRQSVAPPSYYGIHPNWAGLSQVGYYGGGGQTTVAPNLVSGNLGIAGNQGYRNGSADGGALAAWPGASSYKKYVGARNDRGSPDTYVTSYIQVFVIYDVTLTSDQVSAVVTAMAAL